MKKNICDYKKSKFNKLLVGKDTEFTAEHQILNGSIILAGIIYFITFITNYISRLSFPATVIMGIASCFFILLYYLSRKKQLYPVSLTAILILTINC